MPDHCNLAQLAPFFPTKRGEKYCAVLRIEPRVSKHLKPTLYPLHLSGNLSIDLSMLSFIFSYHQIFSTIEAGLELVTMSFSGDLANLQRSLDFGQKNITTIEFSTKIIVRF